MPATRLCRCGGMLMQLQETASASYYDAFESWRQQHTHTVVSLALVLSLDDSVMFAIAASEPECGIFYETFSGFSTDNETNLAS